MKGRRFAFIVEKLPGWCRPFLGGAQIEIDDEGRATLGFDDEASLRFPNLEALLATYRLHDESVRAV